MQSSHRISTDREFAVGDVNNDGYPDIIANDVLINNQRGGFDPIGLSLHDQANVKTQQLADFDNNGSLDLLVTTSWENLSSVYLNDGEGQFTFHTHLAQFDTDREPPAIGDINNDGFNDVVMGISIPNEGTNSSSLKLMSYSNNHGSFTKPKSMEGGVITC